MRCKMKPSKHVDLLSRKYFAYWRSESNEIGASFKIVQMKRKQKKC